MPKKPVDSNDPAVQSSALWDNPYVRGLVYFCGISVALISATIGGVLGFDGRYHKQEEAKVEKAEVRAELMAQAGRIEQSNKSLQLQIEYNADRNRKKALEDQLFKFEMTPEKQRSQTDKALAVRYRDEIKEMVDRWNRIGMPLK